MRTSPHSPSQHPHTSIVALAPIFALVALAAPSGTRAEERPAPKVVDRIHAEGDFIDDPFAISDDGTRIAWITTDGATHARLHLAPIGSAGVKEAARDYPLASITPERVEFLDSEHVIVIERDPSSGSARGEIVGPGGPVRERLGPATDFAVSNVGGTPALVMYLRTGAKTFTHTLTAFRRDNRKLLGKKVLAENAAGRVPLPGGGAPAKPMFFEDGYAELVAQREGAFDKAHDIRRPEVEVRLDVFGGRITAERDIPDPVAFAELQQIRRKFQNVRDFVRFNDDLRRLELVDGEDVVTELHTPRPLAKYDPPTLAFQVAGPGALYVSLTVDPVNAEAVKAKKADQDWLDVYHLDIKEKRLTEVARIDGQKRPTAWRLAGGHLGVLRKHKGFGRGGEDLEIFDVGVKPTEPAKAAPRTTGGPTAAGAGGGAGAAGDASKKPASLPSGKAPASSGGAAKP